MKKNEFEVSEFELVIANNVIGHSLEGLLKEPDSGFYVPPIVDLAVRELCKYFYLKGRIEEFAKREDALWLRKSKIPQYPLPNQIWEAIDKFREDENE